MKVRQARHVELQQAITASTQRQGSRLDHRSVERHVRERLASWRALLTGHVQDGRELFRQVLEAPIRFMPDAEKREYHFEGNVGMGRLLTGLVGLAPFLAPPAGNIRFSLPEIRRSQREAA